MADDRYVWQWLCRGCDVIESIGPIASTPDDTPEIVKHYTTLAFYAHIDWHGCPTPLFAPPRAVRIPEPGELDDAAVLPAAVS
jgi:hypothetical protein